MASKRRRGRPRKAGYRYRSGNLIRPSHEPAISPTAIAAAQPHRKGLGDRASDQLAENELGRMVLRGQISALQHTAGERYAAQWRAYIGTLDGPRWPWRGQGRGKTCNGCLGPGRPEKCACDFARRSWHRSWNALAIAGLATLVSMVVIYDMPCAPAERLKLCGALDILGEVLGLTTARKSVSFENSSSTNLPP
jgi:hypothetical protein